MNEITVKDVVSYYTEVKGCHSLAEISNAACQMSSDEKTAIIKHKIAKDNERVKYDVKNSLLKR